MNSIALTVLTILSHWQKKPIQLVLMILCLSVASALWSGVATINKQAKLSYDKAASIYEVSQVPILISSEKDLFSDDIFSKFRKLGILVSPVISGTFKGNYGEYEISGLDPISKNSNYFDSKANQSELLDFISPPYTVFANSFTAISANQEGLFSQIEINENLADNKIIMDIGIAQEILNKKGLISRLELYSPEHDLDYTFINENKLTLVNSNSSSDFDQLTRSFHLNLTAFGFLAFFVGIFIFYSAINLGIEQKRKLISSLSVIGVSKISLNIAIIIELLIIAIISGLLGTILGYYLATFLLPDVNSTLKGLFGVPAIDGISLPISLWLANFSIVIVGVLLASSNYLFKINKLNILSTVHYVSLVSQNRSNATLLLVIGIIFLAVGIMLIIFSNNLIFSFLLMTSVLLGFTLLLPYMLMTLLDAFSFFSQSIGAKWFWSETKSQTQLLYIALMAIMLAFSINIGVSGMVNSFRVTFTSWLDKRLAAEIYLKIPNPKFGPEILEFINLHSKTILPIYGTNIKIKDLPATIFAFKPHDTYRKNWPLLECLDDCWADIESNMGWLINEQFALKLGLKVGDNLTVSLPTGLHDKKISGIYSDYGNPKIQMMIPLERFILNFPKLKPRTYAVRIEEKEVDKFIDLVVKKFPFDSAWITDQKTVKSSSLKIFEKTFTITNSLSLLTLIISGLAIFSTIISISEIRRSQLAPAWAMGFSPKILIIQEFSRSIMLAIIAIIFAIPLGVIISYILTKYINVTAFGWELPNAIYPNDWMKLIIMSVSIITISLAIPLIRNSSSSAREYLRVFNSE